MVIPHLQECGPRHRNKSRSVPESGALDLARRGEREVVHDLNHVRDHQVFQLTAAVGLDLPGDQRAAGPEHHLGLDRLPEDVVVLDKPLDAARIAAACSALREGEVQRV